jgi:hypothetical protein
MDSEEMIMVEEEMDLEEMMMVEEEMDSEEMMMAEEEMDSEEMMMVEEETDLEEMMMAGEEIDSDEMMMTGEAIDTEETMTMMGEEEIEIGSEEEMTMMMMKTEEKIGPGEVASPEEEMTSAERTSFEEVVKQGAAMTVNQTLGGLGSEMGLMGLILHLTLFPMNQIL